MCCKCNFYFCLWFKITNKMAYYNVILNSPCYSECAKAAAKEYLATLKYQLNVIEKILTDLKCPGFDGTSFKINKEA